MFLLRSCTKPWRLKSRLYKQSPPTRTNAKLRVLKPAYAGFVCVAPDFQSVGDKVQDLSLQSSATDYGKAFSLWFSLLSSLRLVKFRFYAQVRQQKIIYKYLQISP